MNTKTKTNRGALALAALALALAVPAAAAQETQEARPDSVLYRGEPLPVWVMVEDTDEAGVHAVYTAVLWDDHRSRLPFSFELLEGDLAVLLARSDDPDETESCVYRSGEMEHGAKGFHPATRAGSDCLAPPASSLAWVAVEYFGHPMACGPARRQDGGDTPELRVFSCYWAKPPGEG